MNISEEEESPIPPVLLYSLDTFIFQIIIIMFNYLEPYTHLQLYDRTGYFNSILSSSFLSAVDPSCKSTDLKIVCKLEEGRKLMYYIVPQPIPPCRCPCTTGGPDRRPLQPVRLHPPAGEGGRGGARPDAARGGNQHSPAASGASLPRSVSLPDFLYS